jgi:hypothetical protein
MTPAAGTAKELKGSSGRSTKMQFILTGFTQDLGCRVFTFEGVAPDRMRTAFTVRADMALIRRYGIQIQELPLLCRSVLERRDEASEAQAFTFTEDEMRTWATARATAKDEAAQRRKPPRRPSSENLGAAWRAPQP